MARKTINVEAIKDWANDQLLESERTMEGASMYDEIGRGYRQGVMTMLENVLINKKRYACLNDFGIARVLKLSEHEH